MKSFTLNKKSWHYWLATEFTKFNSNNWNCNVDFDGCAYIRAVVLGLIKCCAFPIFPVCWMLISVGVWAVALYNKLIHNIPYNINPFFLTGVGIFCVLLVLLIIAAVTTWWHNRQYGLEAEQARRRYTTAKKIPGAPKYAEPTAKEPSFLTIWYRSVKDKVCFRVKFSDGSK